MTKQEALSQLMVLAAIESWSFSTGTKLPDYLHDNLQTTMEVLEKIVLGEQA